MSEAGVVFFGAGYYAQMVFGDLAKKHSPVAYGDNDPKKQGTRFMGLPVLSLDQIEARHPGCLFYVTVNDLTKPAVVTSLLDHGVAPSRIINYVKSTRYKSCAYLESLMVYHRKKMFFCCSVFGQSLSPSIAGHGLAHKDHLKAFFATRDRIIDEMNATTPETTVQNQCLKCSYTRHGFWPDDRRIRFLSLFFHGICNFRCSYCTYNSSCSAIPGYGSDLIIEDTEDALALLRLMKDEGYVDADTVIINAAGEITVHPLRNELLAAFRDHPCWFFSNASVYNETIAEILSRGRSRICPSVDAGTRETFAKIKGVDMFDKVCENLRRYSSYGFVHLKYIVLPGVNDNEGDIDGFLDICRRLNIKAVDITRDTYATDAFSDHTIDMIARTLIELQRLGICAYAPDYMFPGGASERLSLEKKYREVKND
jgi:pyruvate-formate lyase-activating enzyme